MPINVVHYRLDKTQRQRRVAQSHWKEEPRWVSSHLGERQSSWSVVSEPSFMQEPGCSCPSSPRRDGSAHQNCYPETSIRFQEWRWAIDFRGVSGRKRSLLAVSDCFSFLALCLTFNSPQRDRLTLDWPEDLLSLTKICADNAWVEMAERRGFTAEVNFKRPTEPVTALER